MGRHKKPESQKVSKPGVSLNAECREILRRVLQYELGEHRNEMSHSQAVRKCVRLAWEKHYASLCSEYEKTCDVELFAEGKTAPHLTLGGTNIINPATGGTTPRAEVRYEAEKRRA
jgi:hypothetical protein